eukprot:TRINITY_DN27250_c0_g1_i2.p1 TRINITY_DN27250_c0_g1~~TRINITY_DN27250_c0_g1_i2.p1  ORF type:complete len:425 (-),score=45.17 TRINITY_DN27250_c0_g1_i2:836-2110(-)
MSSLGESGSNLVSFKVLRLCKPNLKVEGQQKINFGEDLGLLSEPQSKAVEFSNRVNSKDWIDSTGLVGSQVLDTNLGTVLLGEKFRGLICIINQSDQSISNVVIRAELHSERNVVGPFKLYDNSQSAVETLNPGDRVDVYVEQDVKEVGQHTLSCSATLTNSYSERRFQPFKAYFNVIVALSVKTRAKAVYENVFLEVCLANQTQNNLVLEKVRCQVDENYEIVESQENQQCPLIGDGPLKEFTKDIQLVRQLPCSSNFMFKLRKKSLDVSSVLGRVEMRWNRQMGETGKLQTQPISSPQNVQKEVRLNILKMPYKVQVRKSFQVVLGIENRSNRALNELSLTWAAKYWDEGSQQATEDPPILLLGRYVIPLPTIVPQEQKDIELAFVALGTGVHELRGIVLIDNQHQKIQDRLEGHHILVKAK